MLSQDMIDAFYALLDRYPCENDFEKGVRRGETTCLQVLLKGTHSLWVEVYNKVNQPVFYPVPSLEELRPITRKRLSGWGSVLAVLNGVHPEDALDWDGAREAVDDIRKYKYEERHFYNIGMFDEYGVTAGILMDILLPRMPDAPPTGIELMIEAQQTAQESGELDDTDYVVEITENGTEVRIPRHLYEQWQQMPDDEDIDPKHKLN